MGKDLVRREKGGGAGDLLRELRKINVPVAYRSEKKAFLLWLEASGTPIGEAIGPWKKELAKPYKRTFPGGKVKTVKRAARSINKGLDAAIYLLRYIIDHSPSMPVDVRFALEQAIRKQGKRIKVERAPVRFLTYEEIDSLISKTAQTDPKLSLWIELLAATGMRVSEMSNLLWTDTKPINGHTEIRVAEKGKERTLEIESEILARAKEVFRDRIYVTGHNGKPYSRNLISMKIKRASAKILGRPDVSAHVLRHSYATHLIQEGAGIQAVQHDLGHSSVSTTLDIYTHTRLSHEERQRFLRIRKGGKAE